eukprot:TRINITY_DN46964_c0_g1_i1.p1 TRINITY_DN46964_c0_g1~~TRINITY_DN46964_c0_g1_i1.p1  ORF type:complete len:641 (+),score=123.68 TRINITY_DN46964_c0_g1_i1:152-2074(+)
MPRVAAAVTCHQDHHSKGTVVAAPKRRKSVAELEKQREIMEVAPVRRRMLQIIKSPHYELALGVVVSFNILLLKEDTDSAVACPPGEAQCTPQWVVVSDHVLLAIYTLDVCCSIFAQRRDFFTLPMNYLDLGIVIMGYIELCIEAIFAGSLDSELSIVRMLRICRMVRVAKLFKPFPELYKLVNGFVMTFRALFWGFVMLMLLLTVWAIVILQIFTALDTEGIFQKPPFNGYWCDDAHESTLKLGLLLWQSLITGDSWGACTLPVVLKHPGMYWVYAGAFVCINIGFTNLILAVIVENASAQHDAEVLHQESLRKEEHERDIEGFNETFKELDVDNSGTVALDEMVSGYQEIPEFQRGLLKFGIYESDMRQVFDCIDLDGSGDITYTEFVDAMLRSQRQNMSTQLAMLQMAVKKLLVGMNTLLKNNAEPNTSPKQPKADAWPSTPSPTLRPVEPMHGKVSEKMDANAWQETKAFSQAPATEQSLECLRQLQMKSLELQLQSTAETVQQHSLVLAQGAQELRDTLAKMQESSHPPGQDEMHRNSVTAPGLELSEARGGNGESNACPLVPETQAVIPAKSSGSSNCHDCPLVPEAQEDSWAVGEEHGTVRTETFEIVALCSVIPCWLDQPAYSPAEGAACQT